MSRSALSLSRNHSSHQKVCNICKGQVFKSSKPNEGYYKVKVENEVKETQIDLNGVPYHKLCAKCSVCQVLITPSTFGKTDVKLKDKPYMLCKDHVNDTTHAAASTAVIIDPNDPLYSTSDPSSNSNPLDIECKHLYLEWTLDFIAKKIIGTATHVVSVRNEKEATSVNFDISALMIDQVYLNGAVAEYAITDAGPNSIVSVKIPTYLQSVKSEMKISFVYSTSPEATAVQWLEAAATKDGNCPYVFTQSQAIHARSMFPCFDAPGVKVPYSAAVTAPAWCTVLMSALACTHNPVPESITQLSFSSVLTTTATGSVTADTAVFYWQQPVPVSAYLVALAAGELSSVDISPRVRVWAEPSVVASAAWEFQQTEQFLTAAESLTACAYQWTRYDVLCLPPSFPYGGMENPCLTFATPTLLAGDRSLANVIAHEIAHSWTGNLVTNATWSHFWLNEGWTVWLERKIMAFVTNSNDTLKLSAQGGWKHLKDDIELIDECFTSLVWPLAVNADPDDAFSSVPYEKGYALLRYLESLVGEAEFLVFVHAYIQQFKYITVTSGQFRDFFMNHFTSAHHTISGHNSGSNSREQLLNKLQALDWSVLLLSQGSPTHPIDDMSNSLSLAAQLLVKQVLPIDSAADNDDEDIKEEGLLMDIKGWSTEQTTLFLDTLLESQSSFTTPSASTTQQPQKKQPILKEKTLQLLDKRYKFTDSNNAEIKFRWQLLCLRCHNTQWIFPHVVAFITSQGRMKYVRPLYRALRDCECGSDDEGARLAAHTFATHQQTYHPVARKMIAKDLQSALEKFPLSSSSQSSSSTSDDPSSIPSPTPAPPAAAPASSVIEAENQLNMALATVSPPETIPNATTSSTATTTTNIITPSTTALVSAVATPTPTPTEVVTAAVSQMDDISAEAVAMTQKEAATPTAAVSSTNDNDQMNRKAVTAVTKESSNSSRWIIGGVLTVAVTAAAVTAFVILKHRK